MGDNVANFNNWSRVWMTAMKNGVRAIPSNMASDPAVAKGMADRVRAAKEMQNLKDQYKIQASYLKEFLDEMEAAIKLAPRLPFTKADADAVQEHLTKSKLLLAKLNL
jgi:hypothetical protein